MPSPIFNDVTEVNKQFKRNHGQQETMKENSANFVAIIVPVDGLAPVGASHLQAQWWPCTVPYLYGTSTLKYSMKLQATEAGLRRWVRRMFHIAIRVTTSTLSISITPADQAAYGTTGTKTLPDRPTGISIQKSTSYIYILYTYKLEGYHDYCDTENKE